MITDWIALGKIVGSLKDDGSESGGDNITKIAFDEILGDEWIQNTVETIVSFKKGSELAMNCLNLIGSTKAVLYAYAIYKSSEGERARQAVWLIKHIVNPISLNWVEELLNDDNVIDLGLGVLDQLLWTEQIPNDDKTESFLDMAETNSKGQLKDLADFIRTYLEQRNRR